MSKEREYLLQAANILSDFTEFDKFASTIYELLAQPEQDLREGLREDLREDLREEPVASAAYEYADAMLAEREKRL